MKASNRLFGALVFLSALGGALPQAGAAEGDDDAALRESRCEVRRTVALTGLSPLEARSLTGGDLGADALLGTEAFRDRIASFLNTQWNSAPGATAGADAPYFVVKEVLRRGQPFRDVFLAKLRVVENPVSREAEVIDDPDGLGYLRSSLWQIRYAGNEPSGLKLQTAYRILHNTVGLKLTAVNNADNDDVTEVGRAGAGCRGCHFEGWSALDPIAGILTRRIGSGLLTEFGPKIRDSIEIEGKTVHDDRELVQALVETNDFRFQSCRLAFRYVHGRDETQCESDVFETCLAAFERDGRIETALGAIVAHPGYCQ